GAKDSKGEILYADWAWDRGLGGSANGTYFQGWRSWKMGGYDGANNSAIIATLGGAAVPALFMTPPTAVASNATLSHLLGIDLDRDAPKLSARSGEYTESVLDFMKANTTDLSAYKNRQGKLLIVHGVSDPVFSVNDTISW